MTSQTNLLLSSYLIKAAGGGLGRVGFQIAQEGARRGARGVAKATGATAKRTRVPRVKATAPATLPPPSAATAPAALPPPAFLSAPSVPAALPPPAFLSAPSVPAAVSGLSVVAPAMMPSGLALARQGAGQVFTGTRQALGSGVSAIGQAGSRGAQALRTGANRAGRGLASVAKDPRSQALGLGLGGAALGTYGMNRLMGGGGGGAQSPYAAPAATTDIAPAAVDSDVTENSRVVTNDGANTGAADFDANPPNPYADLNRVFEDTMGDFDPNSATDAVKMQHLRSLRDRGVDISAPGAYRTIYDPAQGYGRGF